MLLKMKEGRYRSQTAEDGIVAQMEDSITPMGVCEGARDAL